MLHKVTSLREFKRKVSPPQPVFMTDDEKCQFLHNHLKPHLVRLTASSQRTSSRACAAIAPQDLVAPGLLHSRPPPFHLLLRKIFSHEEAPHYLRSPPTQILAAIYKAGNLAMPKKFMPHSTLLSHPLLPLLQPDLAQVLVDL